MCVLRKEHLFHETFIVGGISLSLSEDRRWREEEGESKNETIRVERRKVTDLFWGKQAQGTRDMGERETRNHLSPFLFSSLTSYLRKSSFPNLFVIHIDSFSFFAFSCLFFFFAFWFSSNHFGTILWKWKRRERRRERERSVCVRERGKERREIRKDERKGFQPDPDVSRRKLQLTGWLQGDSFPPSL